MVIPAFPSAANSKTWQPILLHDLLETEIGPLVLASHTEDYTFVDRLVDEYRSGRNRFDLPGEALFGVYDGARLVGAGGLNRDPYASQESAGAATGRVRHLYVLPGYRRRGVGRAIMQAIIDGARPHFARLTLRTFEPEAAALYLGLGFVATDTIDQATHVFALLPN